MLTPPFIAIVDDDEAVRKALKRMLRSLGVEVQAFPSAREFLEVLPAREPEVLLLDLQMPEMSGLELQELLVSQKRRIPIVFITARDDEEVRQQALARGARGFIPKPFERKAILDLIAALLGTDSPASSGKLRLQPQQPYARPRIDSPARDVVDFELKDLLPCPFCRKYPRLDKGRLIDKEGRDRFYARIICARCGAMLGSTPDQVFASLVEAAEDAVKRWNQR